MSERFDTGLTESEWYSLPLVLRQRWWQETDYGAREPSAELLRLLREAARDNPLNP